MLAALLRKSSASPTERDATLGASLEGAQHGMSESTARSAN
jgi:hypothetical protein